jgi:hypothetical protein
MAGRGQGRQGELFTPAATAGVTAGAAPPQLLREQLLAWQGRLAAHQGPLFRRDGGGGAGQGELFAAVCASSSTATSGGLALDASSTGAAAWAGGRAAGSTTAAVPPAWGDAGAAARALDPLVLQAQSLTFWRWPAAPQQGAAIYLVLDRPSAQAEPLLLYVGETARADRRWKGDHDCKGYLAAYSEALHRASLEPRLSIRFWTDVPAQIPRRRALEQALIRLWLPPFNKETRDRWTTPFTADPL